MVSLSKADKHILVTRPDVTGSSRNHSSGRSISPDMFVGKKCSESVQNIYRRTRMPKCDLNKVTLHIALEFTPYLTLPYGRAHKVAAHFHSTFI